MSVVYGYIYILTNKINNKKYVGQTTQTFNKRYCFKGIGAERMYKYHSYMKRKKISYNKHLLSAFEKYELDNFIVEEEFDVAYSKDELDDKEKYYIKLFDSFNKIKLTDIQQNILDNVKKGIIIDDGNRSNFQRVIEKIYKELNKN